MLKTYSEKIIFAFATLSRTTDIARVTGLSRSTVIRMKREPELIKLVDERRQELVTGAVHQMQAELLKTVETLTEIRDDPNVSSQTRVSACNSILNHAETWIELHDIMQRIEKLEQNKTESDKKEGF